MGRGGTAPPRQAGRQRAGPGVGRSGQPSRAGAAYARPVRQPRGRGRVPPELAPPDAHRDHGGAGRFALGRRQARRACRPVRRRTGLGAHRGRPRLSDVYDLRGGPRAARAAGAGEGLRAAADEPGVRARPPGAHGEAGPAGGHGDDREAGRLRRPDEHHDGHAHGRARGVHPARAQVVHLGADVRRVPRAGAGPGRPVLLPGAARAARRHPEHLPHPAAEGQAGQPLQRLLRARVRRDRGLAGRARGPRRQDHHRDGQLHAAGLRDDVGRADAQVPRRGGAPRAPPQRVRRPAGGPAADAQCAG